MVWHMLTDVMDFDPRITSDGHGWHCNFHLGHGRDVILEDAMNEESCVQALQCLIANADDEIHELEDELAILQCQLKWAEPDKNGNPYGVCCATFKQKIDFLTKSMQNLRKNRISNEYDMDTTLEISRPAERIYDIINTLTKQDFSPAEKQVEDTSNEMNLLVNSGSVDIAAKSEHEETTMDSSAESRELTTDFERQFKPVDTVSEESCSDARSITKDSFEDSVLGKTDVEVTKKADVDAYVRTSEVKNIVTTCLQAYNNEGTSKSNALWNKGTENCSTGIKNSGSGSSPLSAKTDVVVKVEVDDTDTGKQNVAADFLCMMQDQETKSLIEGQVKVEENKSPSAHDVAITNDSGRKRSSFGTIMNPQGQKIQKMMFNGLKQSSPMMLTPQGVIGKRNFPSNGHNLKRPSSLSPEANVTFCTLPEAILQRKSVDTMSERNISKKDDLYARENLDSKLHNELVVCPKSHLSGERKTSPLLSSSANSCNVQSKSTVLGIVATKESQAYDLESLRLKFSQQPDFLHKMKIPELKVIGKVNKIKGFSKLKKENMIEELTKLLNTA